MAIRIGGGRYYQQSTDDMEQPSFRGATTTTTVPPGGVDYGAVGGGDGWGLRDRLQEWRANVNRANPNFTDIMDANVRVTGVAGQGIDAETETVGDLLNEVRRWEREEIEVLQAQLWAAGYYSSDVYAGKVALRQGSFDALTQSAFHSLMADALVESKSFEDLFSEGAASFSASGPGGSNSAIVGGGNTYVTETSDPATIRQMASDVAKAVLGKDTLTDEELDKAVASITGAQRSEQAGVHGAMESQDQARFGAQSANTVAAAGGIPSPIAGSWMPGQTIGAGLRRNDDGSLRDHEGFDMMAERGTPVVAVAGGTVRVGRGGRAGLYVYLEGLDGRTYRYMHLDSSSVVDGEQVAPGEQLGAVGDSGNARGGSPHLHFEVEENGRTLDPKAMLAGSSEVGGTVANDTYLPARYVERQQVDAQARLEEQIEADHPVEAEAYDVLGAYNNFRSLFTSGNAQMAPTREIT